MRENFDKAFELTIGLEGHPTNDVSDPGGFTIWGLAKKYHPEIDENTTIDYAKKVYYDQYWLPAGCDNEPFPLDICLFDSQVNPQNDPKLPGGGNQEILSLGPSDWHEYNIFRMQRYQRCSKHEYVLGHICRVLNLSAKIKELEG